MSSVASIVREGSSHLDADAHNDSTPRASHLRPRSCTETSAPPPPVPQPSTKPKRGNPLIVSRSPSDCSSIATPSVVGHDFPLKPAIIADADQDSVRPSVTSTFLDASTASERCSTAVLQPAPELTTTPAPPTYARQRPPPLPAPIQTSRQKSATATPFAPTHHHHHDAAPAHEPPAPPHPVSPTTPSAVSPIPAYVTSSAAATPKPKRSSFNLFGRLQKDAGQQHQSVISGPITAPLHMLSGQPGGSGVVGSPLILGLTGLPASDASSPAKAAAAGGSDQRVNPLSGMGPTEGPVLAESPTHGVNRDPFFNSLAGRRGSVRKRSSSSIKWLGFGGSNGSIAGNEVGTKLSKAESASAVGNYMDRSAERVDVLQAAVSKMAEENKKLVEYLAKEREERQKLEAAVDDLTKRIRALEEHDNTK